MISRQHVSYDEAVRSLVAVGVNDSTASTMCWERRFSYSGRWVLQRSLVDEWIAVFEGAEVDREGS